MAASDESLDSVTFRWHTRVKTGVPELGVGEIETLASHILDENAHPQYIRKGQAVPTGQEYTIVGRHNSYRLAHAPYLVRRDELVRTKTEFANACDGDYIDDANNYGRLAPIRHVITAGALKAILADRDMIPIGMCAISPSGKTATDVHNAYGYGTWTQLATIGTSAIVWQRTA